MSRRNNKLRVKKAMSLLLLLPLCAWSVVKGAPLLNGLAARAALVSACINMPEGSLALLEERFNSELFGAGEKNDVVVPPPPARPAPPPAAPQESDAEEAEPEPERLPERDIPEEYRGSIQAVQYGANSSAPYLPLAAGYLKNSTKLANSAVEKELAQPLELTLQETDEPQVLIIHTHATESYEPQDATVFDTRGTWRDTDNEKNMVQVGKRIARELEAAGIGVVQDATQHDYPSYNGAYERSAQTVKRYLKQYPSIKVVLDVHRDAIQPEKQVIVKSVAEIDGKKAAQIMIITGCEDGTMNVPHWSSNLRFAAALQSTAEASYPGLMRPIFFCYRKYNMDLTRGSILLEVGSHGNTLEEAEYSAELIGKALAKTLVQTKKSERIGTK